MTVTSSFEHLQKVRRIAGDELLRFSLESEFVELLANPHYLQFLAQQRYFADERFLRYIRYLQYWRKPEYIQFITHPHALYFLEMLLDPIFRSRLLDASYIELLHNNQYWHWRYFRSNRYFERHAEELQPSQ